MSIAGGNVPVRGYSKCRGHEVGGSLACLRTIEINAAGIRENTVGEEVGEVCVGVCVCVGRSHRTWLAIIRAFFLIFW